MTTFEDQLFKQRAYWVSELSIDALVPSIFLQLICNPDTGEVECDILFPDVEDVSVTYRATSSEMKNRYLCALLGILDSKGDDDRTRYIITTDTR